MNNGWHGVAAAAAFAALTATSSQQPGQPVGLRAMHISSDGRAIEVARTNDAHLTRIAVLDVCGLPSIGAPQVRAVAMRVSSVEVTYGKHCHAEIQIADLTLRCSGCD